MNMYVWVLIGLVVVLVLKAYTSIELRNLRSRIHKGRKALLEVKEKLPSIVEMQKNKKHDQELMEVRVVKMKAIINDIKIQLG